MVAFWFGLSCVCCLKYNFLVCVSVYSFFFPSSMFLLYLFCFCALPNVVKLKQCCNVSCCREQVRSRRARTNAFQDSSTAASTNVQLLANWFVVRIMLAHFSDSVQFQSKYFRTTQTQVTKTTTTPVNKFSWRKKKVHY